MTDPLHISAEERTEMLRSSAGIVTALVARDESAVRGQIISIVSEQASLAQGDFATFAARMGKQLEASSRVTWHVVMSLAPRLGLSEEETQRVLAQAFSEDGLISE